MMSRGLEDEHMCNTATFTKFHFLISSLLSRMGRAGYSAILWMMEVGGAMLVLMSWIFCLKKDKNVSQSVCEVARGAEGAGF